jgi:hypothetical protein
MSDYDFEPREAPSVFLRLKDKGDKVLIRIASPPYREPKIWKADTKAPLAPEEMLKLKEDHWRTIYRDPDYNVTEVFHWKVIDRESGQAKIFTGTAGVYKQIKDYAEMKGWGDPTTYDFQIERTEEPGRSYYKVTGIPDKEPIIDREQKMVDAIDMHDKLPAARRVSETQIDYIPEMGDEGAGEPLPEPPKAMPTKTPQKDDVVIEDIEGEPINLDDIPF